MKEGRKRGPRVKDGSWFLVFNSALADFMAVPGWVLSLMSVTALHCAGSRFMSLDAMALLWWQTGNRLGQILEQPRELYRLCYLALILLIDCKSVPNVRVYCIHLANPRFVVRKYRTSHDNH